MVGKANRLDLEVEFAFPRPSPVMVQGNAASPDTSAEERRFRDEDW